MTHPIERAELRTQRQPHAPIPFTVRRRIEQIAVAKAKDAFDDAYLYALASDGTLWSLDCRRGFAPEDAWRQLPALPQPTPDAPNATNAARPA